MFQDFFVRSKNGFVHAAVMWVWVSEAGRHSLIGGHPSYTWSFADSPETNRTDPIALADRSIG